MVPMYTKGSHSTMRSFGVHETYSVSLQKVSASRHLNSSRDEGCFCTVQSSPLNCESLPRSNGIAHVSRRAHGANRDSIGRAALRREATAPGKCKSIRYGCGKDAPADELCVR